MSIVFITGNTHDGLAWFTIGGASSHNIRKGVLDPDCKPDRLTVFLETVEERCRFSR